MRTTLLNTLTAGLCTLAVVACGDDPGGGGGAAGDDAAAKRKDAALTYARCMRENGVEMPDPKTDENGMLVIEGGNAKDAEQTMNDQDFQAADGACRKHLEEALPPKLDEAQAKEFKDKALAHAKCMREQGIDFPDPRVGEGGQVSVEIDPGAMDPSSPKFQAAQKKCGSPLGAPETGE